LQNQLLHTETVVLKLQIRFEVAGERVAADREVPAFCRTFRDLAGQRPLSVADVEREICRSSCACASHEQQKRQPPHYRKP
jgi:hypothetical protein